MHSIRGVAVVRLGASQISADSLTREAQERAQQHVLREAKRFERARRETGAPTGGAATATLIKAEPRDRYHFSPQVSPMVALIPEAVDEPSDPRHVDMVKALPLEISDMYAFEDNNVDWGGGKSLAIFKEIEEWLSNKAL